MKIKKKLTPVTDLRSLISAPFTMVEVTMAIGVIAIGMMGIMALFPIGFQAARDAIGDNYSSEMADQFLHIVAMQCKAYSTDDGGTTTDGWGRWITGDPNDGASVSATLVPTDKAGAAATNDQENNINNVTPGTTEVIPGIPGIYYPTSAGNGLFYVNSKSNDVIDFDAVMALWQEDIVYNSAGDTIPNEIATKLCLEISWPVAKPYKYREKRYYVMEIFNPHERKK